MTKSETASRELSNLMLSKAPANLKPEAEQLEQRRATAFKKSTAVYDGAAGGEDAADGEVRVITFESALSDRRSCSEDLG